MLNFTFTLPGRPLWAGPYPNWGFLQITLWYKIFVVWNHHTICIYPQKPSGMPICTQWLGKQNFPKLGFGNYCVPMQHVDVAGATLKFVKINTLNHGLQQLNMKPPHVPVQSCFFLTSVFNIFLHKKLTVFTQSLQFGANLDP